MPQQDKYLIIQSRDEKTNCWQAELKKLKMIALSSSPLFDPFVLLKILINKKRSKKTITGFVIRYLPDSKSLPLSILRRFSEVLVIFLCKLQKIPVYWIAHNIDQETKEHHRWLSNLRRKKIAKNSRIVFCMDNLLVPYVEKYIPQAVGKIQHLTFGKPLIKEPSPQFVELAVHIKEFIKERREYYTNLKQQPLVFIVFGRPNKKFLHFAYAKKLVEYGRKEKTPIIGVVIGSFGDEKFGLDDDPDVFLHDRFIRANEELLADNIDFFFRGYNDVSMSYSLYVAASLRKPVVSLNTGFVAEAVSTYNLGFILNTDFSNFSDLQSGIRNWNAQNADTFLESHSWKQGARLLEEAVISCMK